MIAQQLYEGVEISGRGSIGLITYMRTDSLRISEEAIAAARTYISDHYGSQYIPAQPRRFRAKAGAQDAHEAIRPSDPALTPEEIREEEIMLLSRTDRGTIPERDWFVADDIISGMI